MTSFISTHGEEQPVPHIRQPVKTGALSSYIERRRWGGLFTRDAVDLYAASRPPKASVNPEHTPGSWIFGMGASTSDNIQGGGAPLLNLNHPPKNQHAISNSINDPSTVITKPDSAPLTSSGQLSATSPQRRLLQNSDDISIHFQDGKTTREGSRTEQAPVKPLLQETRGSTQAAMAKSNDEEHNRSHAKEVKDPLLSKILCLEQQIESLKTDNRAMKEALLQDAASTDPADTVPHLNSWFDAMQARQKLLAERISLLEGNWKLENKCLALQHRNDELSETISSFTDMMHSLIEGMGTSATGSRSISRGSHIAETLKTFQKHWAELKQAKTLVAKLGVTPRIVLLCKMLKGPGVTKYLQKDKKQDSSKNFDVQIRPDEALRYAAALDNLLKSASPKITIAVCAQCRLPRFENAPLPGYAAKGVLKNVSEISTTECCRKHICVVCLPVALTNSIQHDWWHNLGSPYWIRCPVGPCPTVVQLRYNVEVKNLLQAMGVQDVMTYTQNFDRANWLRVALEAVVPRPSVQACQVAQRLHRQLVNHRKMNPLLDWPCLDSYGRQVQMLSVDSTDGTSLKIPIFTGLFKRTATAKDCSICAESIYDIDIGDEDSWTAACGGFDGDWMWMVRAFPSRFLLPECAATHDLDVCRGCLARHLASRLDALGRVGCDQMSCPAPGCRHAYTHAQVKQLATPDIFARYDKFRLLSHLATLPNFRWCLREGCQSGQIYEMLTYSNPWDGTNLPDRNRISCDDCNFRMCYNHQVPWHEGLSCEAYNSQQTAEFEATTHWIQENTKKCPGPRCEAFVEKQGGCFHMTCRSCRFEFCWVCLADWTKIQVSGRGYDWTGHAVGCFFREGSAPLPTMLMGDTVQQALNGRG